jgi:hypothetical protein
LRERVASAARVRVIFSSDPAVRERSFEPNMLWPLSRIAGEGAEQSEAGEGLDERLKYLPAVQQLATKSDLR